MKEVSQIKVGDWIWNTLTGEPARIVSIETVWGQQNIQAWLPTSNQLVPLLPEEVTGLEGKGVVTRSELVYILSATKIINLLNSDTSTAPLTADVFPLPHQIYAYKRILNSENIRHLLADEVGLGKTIEAGLILTELKKQGLVKRTLIVVPRGLMKNWVDEMQLRFNEHFQLVIPSDLAMLEEESIWLVNDQVVCSMDSVKPIKKRSGWTSEKIHKYNLKRFHDLVEAGWDLIIVDEAHKLSGSTPRVARHLLGVALSEAAPYLLLLSATPHQGKTEQFKRLISLLDPETFEKVGRINRETIKPYVIRTEKRVAIDAEGRPLFTPRITRLVPVKWKQEHRDQKKLYEDVTEYVRYGYNRALKEKRTYVGFLMVLMQRLVSSSTRAIKRALERRLKVLETGPAIFESEELLSEFWTESTGQQRLDELLTCIGEGLRDEKEEVSRLASLARRCEVAHPDARAETLVEIMYQLRTEENNPRLKFLVFTEFIPTQKMLGDFLAIRGFKVVCLNGSMDLAERLEAQKNFAEYADVMVSTEAGGEGINLQFCHIVFNYDLPWNPMRVEQRIGRIDRIGQQHPVKVYNLVFDNTVEHRVREVLEEKLLIILEEFGVDKLSDVLDAEESETEFERLYRDALLHPEVLEDKIDEYISSIRKRYAQRLIDKDLILDDKTLDTEEALRLSNHPLPYWTRRMISNYIKARGGKMVEYPSGYKLVWPDGTVMNNIQFERELTKYGGVLDLSNPRVLCILNRLLLQVSGMSISQIEVNDLSREVSGFWSLWQISVYNQKTRIRNIFPLFIHDDGRIRASTAFQLWDHLLKEETKIEFTGSIGESALHEIYGQMRKIAEKQGENQLSKAKELYEKNLRKTHEKNKSYYNLRKRNSSRMSDIKTKITRIEELEAERREWMSELEKNRKPVLDLHALVIVHVRGKNV